jgi:hypothetical protein
MEGNWNKGKKMVALAGKTEIVFCFQTNFILIRMMLDIFFHTIYLALLFTQLFFSDKSNRI